MTIAPRGVASVPQTKDVAGYFLITGKLLHTCLMRQPLAITLVGSFCFSIRSLQPHFLFRIMGMSGLARLLLASASFGVGAQAIVRGVNLGGWLVRNAAYA